MEYFIVLWKHFSEETEENHGDIRIASKPTDIRTIYLRYISTECTTHNNLLSDYNIEL